MKKIFLFILLSNLSSCDWCNLLGEQALGGNFSLVEADEDDIFIVYCTSTKCCNVGIPAVPSKVLKVKFDSRWILVNSVNVDKKEVYWIIDKDFELNLADCDKIDCHQTVKSNIYGPLSLSQFEDKKDSLEIVIEL